MLWQSQEDCKGIQSCIYMYVDFLFFLYIDGKILTGITLIFNLHLYYSLFVSHFNCLHVQACQ